MAWDCKELFEQGNTCSGVYTIKPDELPAFAFYEFSVNFNKVLNINEQHV